MTPKIAVAASSRARAGRPQVFGSETRVLTDPPAGRSYS